MVAISEQAHVHTALTAWAYQTSCVDNRHRAIRAYRSVANAGSGRHTLCDVCLQGHGVVGCSMMVCINVF